MFNNKLLILLTIVSLVIGVTKNDPIADPNILHQVESCFIDGQIPCRWSMSSNNQLGSFQLNSVPLFPYYLALVPRLFGFDYQVSLNMTYLIFVLFLIYFLYSKLKQNIFTTISLVIISYLTNSVIPITLITLFIHFSKTKPIPSSILIGLLIFSINKLLVIPILITILIATKIINHTKLPNIIYSLILGICLAAFYFGPSFTNTSKLPNSSNPNKPITISGQAQLSQYKTRSNFWRLTAEVAGNQTATIIIPVAHHPSWKILINQQPLIPTNNQLLEPTRLNIPPGNHTIVAFLENDTKTFIFNLISLVTITYIFVISFPYHEKKLS